MCAGGQGGLGERQRQTEGDRMTLRLTKYVPRTLAVAEHEHSVVQLHYDATLEPI